MKYKIRSQFIASPGYTFLAFDLSQAETWVVAHLTNDERMINALKHSDIHALTASAIYYPHIKCTHDVFKSNIFDLKECNECHISLKYEERYMGKKSNHGFSYRMGAARATQAVNSQSDEPPFVTVTEIQMKNNRNTWLSLYPGIQNWWADIEEKLRRNNRTITTTYGRSRTFFERWGDELFKEATAYEPQSTVADHGTGVIHPDLGIVGGIVGIAEHPVIAKFCNLVHTAYDSITLEVPDKSIDDIAPIVHKLFGRPLIVDGHEFTIPCDAEVGDRLGEMERYIMK